MTTNQRLEPLLEQYDWATERLLSRLAGPTIAWRLDHISETLLGRSNHLGSDRTFNRTEYEPRGDAAGAIARLREAVDGWRRMLLGVDESDYDRTGLSSYPYGSDAEETFPAMVWWMNQEILHHGAEIALLRDLYLRRSEIAAG